MGRIKDISTPAENDTSAELNYFFDVLDHFINIAKTGVTHSSDESLTLITRAPDSAIARAILQYREKFAEINIPMQIIFAHLTPSEYLCNWIDPEISPCGETPTDNIRWAKRHNLLDAHEQLTLSNHCSWSGESMRREVSSRFGFYIFDENCPKAAIRGERSFNALWKISETLPQAQIKRAKLARDSQFLGVHGEQNNFSSTEAGDHTSEFTRH